MTRRNRWQGSVQSRLSMLLGRWLETRPEPRGQVVSGEAGFRLRRDPDSTVGIDVAYVSPEVAFAEPDTPYYAGPPVLAVEILSPSDRQEEIDEKIQLYLEVGVSIVWVVHPRFRTITVYRADSAPMMFSGNGEIASEPKLPGLRLALPEIFGPEPPGQ